MVDKVKEAISHNYDPVNQYIDDQARLKRSASIWRYAKSISLILVAIGVLFILLAWAYNIFKKPNPQLVKKINEVDKKFEQSQSLDKPEEKLLDGEIIRYNSQTFRFLNAESEGYKIVTRIKYSTTKDLLEGNKPQEVTCYIEQKGTTFEFDQNYNEQNESLKILGLNLNRAERFKRFCQYNVK